MTPTFARHTALTLALAISLLAPAALAQNATETAGDTAAAPAPSVGLELNRLEDLDGVCRAYFIVDNETGGPLSSLQLDTFLFDESGVIAERVALTFVDIRAGREKVALFDFEGTCTGFGRFLINEVMACEDDTGPLEGCAEGLTASSAARAPLQY